MTFTTIYSLFFWPLLHPPLPLFISECTALVAGPNGLLGAAEGMGFLAVLAGVIVLGFQIADYGFIPNAVPSEGSKCQ